MCIKELKSKTYLKILIVDDDPNIVDLEIAALKQKNKHHEILSAFSAKEAIEIAINNANSIDIILLDFQMPDFNGIDILRTLKLMSMTQNIPVVMISGSPDIKRNLSQSYVKPDEYMEKPFNILGFADKIEEIYNNFNSN